MYKQKLLLLAVLTIASFAAYLTHVFWKKRIDPRRSMQYFLLYVAAHLISIFVVVFLFSTVIFRFKEFFFHK